MKKQNWVQEFSISKDGFHGHLFRPTKDAFPGKALLVLGGGGVPYLSTLDMAKSFTKFGITALAVGYFNVKNAPKTIIKVPVEYVKNASNWLHNNGVETVIAIGISKGAEFALVAASLLPQINGVIALSPSNRVNMGVGSGISWVKASSWTFNGKELPYAYAPASGFHALQDSLRARELTFRPVYVKANQSSLDECFIPVEKIQGPVLVVAALYDSLWPSAPSCHEIIKRLNANDFAYPHKELVYQYASHLLLPYETSFTKLFCVGRKHPEQCIKTVYALQAEIIEWLRIC